MGRNRTRHNKEEFLAARKLENKRAYIIKKSKMNGKTLSADLPVTKRENRRDKKNGRRKSRVPLDVFKNIQSAYGIYRELQRMANSKPSPNIDHGSDLPFASELSDCQSLDVAGTPDVNEYMSTKQHDRPMIDSDNSAHSSENPLTMEERIDLVELDIEQWLPMLFHRKGRVGAFVWSVFQHSAETFIAQMQALIDSAQPILDRIFELSSLCVAETHSDFERIQDLCLSVHLIVADITVRVAMVQRGLIDRFPEIMAWEK